MYIFSIVLCTSVYIVTIYLPSPHTLLTLYQCHNVIEPLRTKLPWGDLPLEFEVVQYYHPLAAQYIMARLIRSAPPPPPPPQPGTKQDAASPQCHTECSCKPHSYPQPPFLNVDTTQARFRGKSSLAWYPYACTVRETWSSCSLVLATLHLYRFQYKGSDTSGR